MFLPSAGDSRPSRYGGGRKLGRVPSQHYAVESNVVSNVGIRSNTHVINAHQSHHVIVMVQHALDILLRVVRSASWGPAVTATRPPFSAHAASSSSFRVRTVGLKVYEALWLNGYRDLRELYRIHRRLE